VKVIKQPLGVNLGEIAFSVDLGGRRIIKKKKKRENTKIVSPFERDFPYQFRNINLIFFF